MLKIGCGLSSATSGPRELVAAGFDHSGERRASSASRA
jgi:hypothetical protein